MARPQSHTITVREAFPGRPKPWGAFWREPDATGRRQRKAEFFATHADAIAFKTKHEANAAAMPPPAPVATAPPPIAVAPVGDPSADDLAGDPGTLKQFAARWLVKIVSRRKQSTQKSYREMMTNHVYDVIGTVPIKDIRSKHVVHLVTERAAAGVEWGTQKVIIRVLSACLRWAVRYGHLEHNPCLQLTKELKDDSRGEYEDPEPNPLSSVQARNFLTWLQTGRAPGAALVDPPASRRRGGQRKAAYPEWYAYFLTLFLTGMRRGEAAGLQWTTVNLAIGKARLERNYSPAERAATDGDGDVTLKGKRAHDIELDAELIPVLAALERTQLEQALRRGRKASPYVFTSLRGCRITSDSSTAERVFAAGMTAIGAASEGHTIHDCRDTFATMHLLKNSGKLAWVSWMLGHRQRSTTWNRYAKFIPEWAGDVRMSGDLNLTGAIRLPDAEAK